MKKPTKPTKLVKQEKTIASAMRVFAGDNDDVVFQLLNEDKEVIAELAFAKEMSDVALAYMMYAQGAAFGVHPKSGWIH